MSTGTATIRKFCTLQEAAERLDTTQEKIEMLLHRGVLHEFRDGPHRLLRTAEVGALAAARIRRLERQGQPAAPSTADPDRRSASDRPQKLGVPRSSNSSSHGARPRTTRLPQPPVRRSSPSHSSSRPRATKRRTRPVAAPRPSLSVREWFWSGLIQDRPTTIALLSGMVLLGLATAVAGICALADTLR
jgi:excisionase family DNA binding protein